MFNEFEQTSSPSSEVKNIAVAGLKSPPAKPEDLVMARAKYEETTRKPLKSLVKDRLVDKEFGEKLKSWPMTATDPSLIENKANWIQNVAYLEDRKLIQKSEVKTYLQWASSASAEHLEKESTWLTSVVRLHQKKVIDQSKAEQYIDGILNGKQDSNQKASARFIVPLGKLVEGNNHDRKYIKIDHERAVFLLKTISECNDRDALVVLASTLQELSSPRRYLPTAAKVTHGMGPRHDPIQAAKELSEWVGKKIDAAKNASFSHLESATSDQIYMMTKALRIFLPSEETLAIERKQKEEQESQKKSPASSK